MQKVKFILISVTVMCITIVSAWAIMPPIGQDITTTGYVAVRLPAGYGCSSYGLVAYDGAAYYIASKSDGSDGELYPAGFRFTSNEKYSASNEGTVICYAKGTTSTRIVGLFVW
jgi:hypothetical protein